MVIDASALTEVVLDRPETRANLRAALSEAPFSWLHAPELIDLEVVNTLRRLVSASLITERRATEAVSDIGRARIRRHRHGSLRRRIWALRNELTAYDASYLALAERLGAALITSDAGLAARARDALGAARVRHLG
ncbi:MAG TPA: type II toxin-antitoxin system VapC family toxin [Thermoleophilaceae bacterium]|nr:type II toxin-antitoxin system VapC family toxin [Thermoleophilaceae bacterium]